MRVYDGVGGYPVTREYLKFSKSEMARSALEIVTSNSVPERALGLEYGTTKDKFQFTVRDFVNFPVDFRPTGVGLAFHSA